MGKILTRDDIFSKKGLDARTVNVPEWGGDVMYRPMSMVERREVRKKCSTTIVDKDGQTKVELDAEKLEVLTLVYCVIDSSDPNKKKLLFDVDDIDVLESQMCAGGISTVAQTILKESGMAGNATFRSEEIDKK